MYISAWELNDTKFEDNSTETRFGPQCHRKGPCFLELKNLMICFETISDGFRKLKLYQV